MTVGVTNMPCISILARQKKSDKCSRSEKENLKGKLLVADAPLSLPTGVHKVREIRDLEMASALEQAPPYNLSPPFFLTGNLKHHLRPSLAPTKNIVISDLQVAG